MVNGSLIPEDKTILETYGRVDIRPNKGYDTAAFRHGILAFANESLSHFDELLLVNDTNVGPFIDLEKSLKNGFTKTGFLGNVIW